MTSLLQRRPGILHDCNLLLEFGHIRERAAACQEPHGMEGGHVQQIRAHSSDTIIACVDGC
jgi:hypothetical protein